MLGVMLQMEVCKGRGLNVKHHKGISLLSMVRKLYQGILVDRVHRVTNGSVDNGQQGFRSGKGVCKSSLYL